MSRVIIVFIVMILSASQNLPAGEKPDIRSILSGKVRVWSDFNHRSGYRMEAVRGPLSVFLTEAVNSRGHFRTGGAEGPFFLTGPLERTGLIKDLFSDRFSTAGTFSSPTGLKSDRDTLSSKSMGCSLFLPEKKGGLWYERTAAGSASGLWFNGGILRGIGWETAFTATARDKPAAPDDWYPEKWEKPGGWILGGGTRLTLRHGIFTGGMTLLAGLGETILPGLRGELLLHWARGRNYLTFHGGWTLPEYRNAGGDLPETLQNGILRFQFKGPLPFVASGEADYSHDRYGYSRFKTGAGLRFEGKTATGTAHWEYAGDFTSGVGVHKGVLGLNLDFGSWDTSLKTRGDFPTSGGYGLKLDLAAIWSDGRALLSAGAGWDSEEPDRISLKAGGGWSESGLTVTFGSAWTTDDPEDLPELLLIAEYRI